MLVDLVLKGAKVYTHGEVIEAGLAIDGGRITRIAKEANLPSASRRMDLQDLLVLPGLIDAHVHLRDQELDYKEDFFSGTSAAANGGVTFVIDMPNNRPVTMSAMALRERRSRAAQRAVVNVAFQSAFPERSDEMQRIAQEGAKAFKLYLPEKIGGVDPDDDVALGNAFKETARLGVPACVHAEDRALLQMGLKKAERERGNDADAYLRVHSAEAEARAVSRIIDIGKETNARIHICHISTGKGLGIVSSANKAGLSVSCEITPHHLLLSSRRFRDLGAVALTNPPLRPEKDLRSLWTAVHAGSVDILVTDHAPHAAKEKAEASIWENLPGIAGLETLLPLMLTQVDEGRLLLSSLVRMTSEKPAKVFGIGNRGDLKEGAYADLVVVDLKKKWKIDSSRFHSKAKFSPFDGWQVQGKPVKTFVNGRLVMDDGEIVAKPGDGFVAC